MSELGPSSYDRPHSMDSPGRNADMPFGNHELYGRKSEPLPPSDPIKRDLYERFGPDYDEGDISYDDLPDYGDAYPDEIEDLDLDDERLGDASNEVRRSIHQIEATETVIAKHTGETGQELTDSTDRFLVDHAESSVDIDSSDKEEIVETALIEGALEATRQRPEATENPIIKLEKDGYSEEIIDGVKKLHEEGAKLPDGESAAEVVARAIDKHDEENAVDKPEKPVISDELDTAIQYYAKGASREDVERYTGLDPAVLTEHIKELPDDEREFLQEMRQRSRSYDKAELEASLDQQAKNEKLLGSSEMGPFLVDAYRSAVELDPRMAEIAIVSIEDENDTRHGYASSKESKNNVTGQHEVHIRLGDLDKALDKYRQAMQDVPEAIAIIAGQLGVPVEEVTPQLLYLQSVLHEIGHLTEHMDAEEAGNPRAGMELRKKEMAEMPLGALVVSKLSDSDSAQSKWFEQEWKRQAKRHGVSTKEELIDLQSRAYRNLTSEKIADNFATNVFDMNPQLKQAMIDRSLDNTISERPESNLSQTDSLTSEQEQRKRWQEYTDVAVGVLEQRGISSEQVSSEASELVQGLTDRIRQIHEQASQEGRLLTDSEKGLIAGIKQTIDAQNRISAVFQARHGHKAKII